MTKLQQALAKAKAKYEAKGYTVELDTIISYKEYSWIHVKKGQYSVLIFYHDNGNMSSISRSKNGKLHGLSKHYYYNGKLHWQAGYKNGKLHGYHKIFHDGGKLVECIKYDNDQQID